MTHSVDGFSPVIKKNSKHNRPEHNVQNNTAPIKTNIIDLGTIDIDNLDDGLDDSSNSKGDKLRKIIIGNI